MTLNVNGTWLRVAASAVVGVCIVAGCKTSPQSESATVSLNAESTAAVTTFKAKDPTLAALMNRAVGYAVFPNVGKAGFIIGGSYGRGEVYEGGKKIGYADVTEWTAGAQIGAQSFSELLLFFSQEEMNKFKSGDFSLGANASAVALAAGAAATTDPKKGVVAFINTTGGLMAEAAVSGQRLRFHAE